MAEPVNAPKAPAVPPPPPVAAAPAHAAPAAPPKENAFLKAAARALTSTFFFGLGLGLIALGILLRFHPGLVPSVIQPVFDRFIPKLPYFVTAFGLLFLGQARSMVAAEYTKASKKNKQYPHAWKIPLIAVQAFILQFVGFIYGLAAGLGWMQPVKNLMGLLFLLFLFFLYVLWYVISHLQHHFPSIAALRVAMLASIIALFSFGCWTTLQMILLSLVIGIFALITALASIGISSTKSRDVQQRGGWAQLLCLVITVGCLLPVASKAWPYGEARTELVNLGLASKGIEGTVQSLCYSLDGKKIAFAQKTKGDWFVQIVNPENESLPVFKVSAGEDAFHAVFVQGGKALLIDGVKNGARGLWKINPETGAVVILRSQGVEPLGDGIPWSGKNGQFLYVTRTEDGYRLNALTLANGKSKALFTSAAPIRTPSWTPSGQEIAYADGVHGLFNLFHLKSKEKTPLESDLERVQGDKFVPEGLVDEAIPSPDEFRYLYVTHKDKVNAIWVVRTDGTKRDKLYETTSALKNVAWHPDGQKIIFEEKYGRLKYWFVSQPSCVKILDANLGTVENLIPPQISNQSPAVSPDGVKIAFAASEGLWYPSFGQGIWVAVLR